MNGNVCIWKWLTRIDVARKCEGGTHAMILNMFILYSLHFIHLLSKLCIYVLFRVKIVTMFTTMNFLCQNCYRALSDQCSVTGCYKRP